MRCTPGARADVPTTRAFGARSSGTGRPPIAVCTTGRRLPPQETPGRCRQAKADRNSGGLAGLEALAHVLHLKPKQAERAVVLPHLRGDQSSYVVGLVEASLKLHSTTLVWISANPRETVPSISLTLSLTPRWSSLSFLDAFAM